MSILDSLKKKSDLADSIQNNCEQNDSSTSQRMDETPELLQFQELIYSYIEDHDYWLTRHYYKRAIALAYNFYSNFYNEDLHLTYKKAIEELCYADHCVEKAIYVFTEVLIKGFDYACVFFNLGIPNDILESGFARKLIIEVLELELNKKNFCNIDSNLFFDYYIKFTNIPFITTYGEKVTLPERVGLSFADLIDLINVDISNLSMSNDNLNIMVWNLFMGDFENFFACATIEDFDVLYDFAIIIDKKQELRNRILSLVELHTQNGLSLNISYNIAMNISIEDITELILLYPEATVPLLKFLLYAKLYVASKKNANDNLVLAEEIVEIFKTIETYYKYRAEEFYFSEDYKQILSIAIFSLDGESLYQIRTILQDTFGVSKEEIETYLIETMDLFLWDYSGEKRTLTCQEISYIISLLSDKLIFDIVDNDRPEIISMF